MNISFSATKQQFRARRKHVTRRLDRSLRLYRKKPGDILTGIEKAQGLKKGEHIIAMGDIVILETIREPLIDIVNFPIRLIPVSVYKQYNPREEIGVLPTETELEGFPELSPAQFVTKFCQINPKCTPETEITRILFDYVDKEEPCRT